jgi:hypothetical protein
MAQPHPMLLLLAATLTVGAAASVVDAAEVVAPGCAASRPDPDEARTALPVVGTADDAAAIDPAVFFDQLVRRYRSLHLYRDTARLVHVTKRVGEEDTRLETEIGCEIREGNLHVQTPASQARSALHLDLPLQHSPAAEKIARDYDLWLAPHMALRFVDEPLKEFRAGVEEGFTPTEAEQVTIDDKPMVHVELRSGDGLSENSAAKFDLFINPETMLVERIDGEQRLPDGGSCTTTLHITPQEIEGGEPTMIQ